MKSEEPAPFRANPSVAMMILVTMTALFVPILCVVWLGRDYFRPRPAGTVEVAGLRETFERGSEGALTHEPLAPERPVLRLKSGSPAVALEEIVKPLGATAVSLGGERYLVTGPPGTAATLAKMWKLEPPAESDEGLFEVDMTVEK